MQNLIRVCLKGINEKPITLQFSANMKLSQLEQFLSSCSASTGADLHHHLRTILAPPSHILADYMLTSGYFFLEDLAEVVHLAQKTVQVIASDSKRSEQKQLEPFQKSQTILLTFDSIQETQSLSFFKEQHPSYSFKNLISCQYPQSISFQSFIFFDEERGLFLECFDVNKSELQTFEKMQRLFLIKNKLLQYGAHHFQPFGDLVEIKENTLTICFCFLYVPKVSLRDVLSQECSITNSEIFSSKIWANISHLRNNGFEDLIHEIVQSREELKNFLDRHLLGIDGRLYLKDLNIVCSGQKQRRLNTSWEKQLFEQIRSYVRQEIKPNKQVKGQNSQKGLSISLFSKLFLSKHFTIHKRRIQVYIPQTELFIWKKRGTADEPFNVYEAVTTKKQKTRQVKKQHKKTAAPSKRLKYPLNINKLERNKK